MATTHQTFVINSTTPIQINNITSTNKRNGLTIVLNTDKNNNKTIFIGGTSAVSQTNFGYHFDADMTLVLHGYFDYTDDLWAICEANGVGIANLHVLTMGL